MRQIAYQRTCCLTVQSGPHNQGGVAVVTDNPPLTAKQIQAQERAAAKLRALRHEGEALIRRRDDAITAARSTGMSRREIGSNLGMSGQGILNILNSRKVRKREL